MFILFLIHPGLHPLSLWVYILMVYFFLHPRDTLMAHHLVLHQCSHLSCFLSIFLPSSTQIWTMFHLHLKTFLEASSSFPLWYPIMLQIKLAGEMTTGAHWGTINTYSYLYRGKLTLPRDTDFLLYSSQHTTQCYATVHFILYFGGTQSATLFNYFYH